MAVPKRGPKMTAARRRSLPESQFGLPSSRKYPLDSRGRAANAKARASQQYNKGNLSKSQKALIVTRANRVLAQTGTNMSRMRSD